MTVQPELPIRTKPDAHAERAREDADALVSALRSLPVLQRKPARDVCVYLDWTDRRLRAAAEAAEGRILSAPGATGYRLAETTSVASYYEVERAAYLSQIRVMTSRLTAMDRAVHGAAPRPKNY